MNVVRLEIGRHGQCVTIEPTLSKGPDRRVFRQIGDQYEWCHFSDWRQNNIRARWYGWASRELPDSMRVK